MAWITPTIAAIGAVSSIAGAASQAGANPSQSQDKYGLLLRSLQNSENNDYNQALVQALINSRSVAGQRDSLGNSLEYDPGSNTWITKLSPESEAAQRSADQATTSRNTTDFRQAQFANADAAKRAAQGGSYADTTRRNLTSFKPMGADNLIGLLQDKATTASNATFSPMVQNLLTSFTRTGADPGQALGGIGRAAAGSLREGLIDAQIKGMTGVDQINQGRKGALESSAMTGAALANPQFQYSGIQPSNATNTMAQVAAQRAQSSAIAPAYGAGAANTANKQVSDAYNTAAAGVPNPNEQLINNQTTLSNIGKQFGAGGSGSLAAASIYDYIKKNKTGPGLQSANDWMSGTLNNPDFAGVTY